jgi:tRNA(Arg) A34 adenosine deaminase TadA
MIDYFTMAANVALPTTDNDPRNFWIAAIGIREDGTIVSAKNGAVQSTDTKNYQFIPESHAEGRALRKLGKGGILYVARVAKFNRHFAMSRPCQMCAIRIKAYNVKKVYYTINENQYGVWTPGTDYDRVFNL